MALDEKLEILKRNNPFTSSSVGDPWESKYPDVPSINEQAFRGLCQLMDQKAKNPSLNCAGLIVGEVGSGKTHLLGKILDYTQQAKPPFAFAYIQPLEDPEQTYRYLLREVMVNLCRPIEVSSQTTQLERVLAEIYIDAVLEEFRVRKKERNYKILCELRKVKDPVHIWKSIIVVPPTQFADLQKKALYLVLEAHPEISKSFLKVLLQYEFPERRLAVMEWLKGSILDKEDAALLQVPERSAEDRAAPEQEARTILISLGLLLARYRQPLVVCFDRLENLETDGQIHSLGKILEFLVDKAKAMLPIACFRGQQWVEKFKDKFNQHVVTRLETNTFGLRGCTADQAMAIIRSRLAAVLGENPIDPFFPFDKQELLKMFKTGFHIPRLVIARANQRLTQILEEGPPIQISPFQKLQEEFEKQYQAILRDLDRYPPDRGRLR
ncbi:MAG: ATP-binding protein, partial [Nitrospira sp.]|nr:ATP-binding protein [Nitrospira sp.]